MAPPFDQTIALVPIAVCVGYSPSWPLSVGIAHVAVDLPPYHRLVDRLEADHRRIAQDHHGATRLTWSAVGTASWQ